MNQGEYFRCAAHVFLLCFVMQCVQCMDFVGQVQRVLDYNAAAACMLSVPWFSLFVRVFLTLFYTSRSNRNSKHTKLLGCKTQKQYEQTEIQLGLPKFRESFKFINSLRQDTIKRFIAVFLLSQASKDLRLLNDEVRPLS